MVGVQAVLNPEIAAVLDADAWAPTARTAIQTIAELAPARPRVRGTAAG